MEIKYRSLRDALKPCCGSKPEINEFIDYYLVKCTVPADSCRRTMLCYELDPDKIAKLWNYMVEQKIGLVDLRRNYE